LARTYDLMLLADPGPARSAVLRALQEAPDVRPDAERPDRYWLQTPHGEVQINIGSKDPVESIHFLLSFSHPELPELVARRVLSVGNDLGMRLDDVQWGHEVTPANLPEFGRFCRELAARPPIEAPETRRPWWRFWG